MSKASRRKRKEEKDRPSKVHPEWDGRTRHYLSEHSKKLWRKSDGVDLILAKYAKEMDGKLVRSPVELSHAAKIIRNQINAKLPKNQRSIEHTPLLEILMRAKNPAYAGSHKKKSVGRGGGRRRQVRSPKSRRTGGDLDAPITLTDEPADTARRVAAPPKNVKHRFGKETTIGRILSLQPDSPFPLEDLLQRSLELGVSMSTKQAKKKKKKRQKRVPQMSPSAKYAHKSLEEAIKCAREAASEQSSLADSLGRISFFVGDHLDQSFDISKYLLQALGDNFVAKDNATLGSPMLSIPMQDTEKATDQHIMKALTKLPLVEHNLDSDAHDDRPLANLFHPTLKFRPVKVQPMLYHPRSALKDISRGEQPDPFRAERNVAFMFNYKKVIGEYDELNVDAKVDELVQDRTASTLIGKKGNKITSDWNTRVGDDPGDRKAELEALTIPDQLRPNKSLKIDPDTKEAAFVKDKLTLGVQDIKKEDEYSDNDD